MKCYKRCGYLIHRHEDVDTLGRLQGALQSLMLGADFEYAQRDVARGLALLSTFSAKHYYEEVPEPVEVAIEEVAEPAAVR